MHYYKYLHSDWVIASETPRPDLLEWAYWTEIPESEVPQPEPHEHVHLAATSEPEPEPEPEAKPATKAARRPRTRKE
ncbi:hypothetical protein [Nocardia sp. CC227C]|uniref:hypothetical protein n=1 Tax=Nocardia sp. CC227C TaxID=3044562 RepID=UPI00278C21D0|nr:hypothetical protein [Nocardia sp. CC227C]